MEKLAVCFPILDTWSRGGEAGPGRLLQGTLQLQAGLVLRNSKCSTQTPGSITLSPISTPVPLTTCHPQYSSALVYGSIFTVPKAGLG